MFFEYSRENEIGSVYLSVGIDVYSEIEKWSFREIIEIYESEIVSFSVKVENLIKSVFQFLKSLFGPFSVVLGKEIELPDS